VGGDSIHINSFHGNIKRILTMFCFGRYDCIHWIGFHKGGPSAIWSHWIKPSLRSCKRTPGSRVSMVQVNPSMETEEVIQTCDWPDWAELPSKDSRMLVRRVNQPRNALLL
jgi:hypothetical protein